MGWASCFEDIQRHRDDNLGSHHSPNSSRNVRSKELGKAPKDPAGNRSIASMVENRILHLERRSKKSRPQEGFSGNWEIILEAYREIYRFLKDFEVAGAPSDFHSLMELVSRKLGLPNLHMVNLELRKLLREAEYILQLSHQISKEISALTDNDRQRLTQRLIQTNSDIQRALSQYKDTVGELNEVQNGIRQEWRKLPTAWIKSDIRQHIRKPIFELTETDLSLEQERLVSYNHEGHARIMGPSGTGKTLIIIYRAIRLAKENSSSEILIITLNPFLAADVASQIEKIGGCIPNIRVSSFYSYICKVLREVNMKTFRLHDGLEFIQDATGIPISWNDFFDKCSCPNTKDSTNSTVFAHSSVKELLNYIKDYINKKSKIQSDTKKKFVVEYIHNSISEYIREELEYVQSIFSRKEQNQYFTHPREGRGIVFHRKMRSAVLQILKSWHEWLDTAEILDRPGLAREAEHLLLEGASLKFQFSKFCQDHILVDEVQDFSTLELRMLKAFSRDSDGKNALFFSGDLDQKLNVGQHRPMDVGLDFTGRSNVLRRNYRNTIEIFSAAQAIVAKWPNRGDEQIIGDSWESSQIHGPKPFIVGLPKVRLSEQYMDILNILANLNMGTIGILSPSRSLLDLLAKKLRSTDIPFDLIQDLEQASEWADGPEYSTGSLVVCSMESAKGLEFDSVLLCDVSGDNYPATYCPEEELFRYGSRLNSAMTRARTNLIITYHEWPSIFLDDLRNHAIFEQNPNLNAFDKEIQTWLIS